MTKTPAYRFKKGREKTGGRGKGSKNKKTIIKEKAQIQYEQEMLKLLMPLTRAQQQAAQGLVVVLRPRLVKNPKTKKLERTGELVQVKDPDEIEELFNSDGIGKDYHIVFAKDPNIKALSDIFDRVFGKSRERIEFKGEIKNIEDESKTLTDLFKNADPKVKKEFINAWRILQGLPGLHGLPDRAGDISESPADTDRKGDIPTLPEGKKG